MLEREELGFFEAWGREARDEGFRIGYLEASIHTCRALREKADTAELKAFYHFYFLGLSPEGDPEEGEDLLAFLDKYWQMDEERIAWHVLRESEFMHCEMVYDEPDSLEFQEAEERETQRFLDEDWPSSREKPKA